MAKCVYCDLDRGHLGICPKSTGDDTEYRIGFRSWTQPRDSQWSEERLLGYDNAHRQRAAAMQRRREVTLALLTVVTVHEVWAIDELHLEVKALEFFGRVMFTNTQNGCLVTLHMFGPEKTWLEFELHTDIGLGRRLYQFHLTNTGVVWVDDLRSMSPLPQRFRGAASAEFLRLIDTLPDLGLVLQVEGIRHASRRWSWATPSRLTTEALCTARTDPHPHPPDER